MAQNKAREKYLAKVKYNQQVAEVEKLYQARVASGMSQAQAATQAYAPGEIQSIKSGTYTVKNSDNLGTIASATGTTPDALLAANPDVNQIKTGMVIQTPGSEAWRVQNAYKGGVGLPSNGPLGVQGGTAAQNQGGQVSMWGGVTPGYNSLQTQTPSVFQTVNNANPFAKYEYKPPSGFKPPAWNPNAFATPAQNYVTPGSYQPNGAPYQATQQQQQNKPSSFNTGIAPQMAFRRKDDYIPTELAALINLSSTRYPTQSELAYLEKYGMITKTRPQQGYGGGGNSRYKGGGGGGGGGGRGSSSGGGGGYERPSQPAFSSGAGFKGLVNWRI